MRFLIIVSGYLSFMAPPKVTLRYANPLIVSDKYPQLEVAMAKLAMNGVQAEMLSKGEGSIEISLQELWPGGLERAVSECVEIFIPLMGVHDYNSEGLRVTEDVLGQLGYKLGEVPVEKKPFFARLFNKPPYLQIVSSPERVQEIIKST